jgi:hypothetical protein
MEEQAERLGGSKRSKERKAWKAWKVWKFWSAGGIANT